jgi:hypothetical protein
MAEGVGFEPTLEFPLSLISSQVPSTTQPPFLRPEASGFSLLQLSLCNPVFHPNRSPAEIEAKSVTIAAG